MHGLNTPAIIEIVRDGQETPGKSNKVCAKATLFLPKSSGGSFLAEKIRFGKPVDVFGEYLQSAWGQVGEDKKPRYNYRIFAAETWEEAFNSAMDYARPELQKLLDALQNRNQALLDAEPKKKLISESEIRELENLRIYELQNSIETDESKLTFCSADI